MSANTFTLTGTIVDVTTKVTPSGAHITELTIEVPVMKYQKGQPPQKTTERIPVKAVGRDAERFATLPRLARVTVTGRLRAWTGKAGYTNLEATAETVDLEDSAPEAPATDPRLPREPDDEEVF